MTSTKARPKTVSQEIEERTDRCYAYKELTFDTEGERNAYLHALQSIRNSILISNTKQSTDSYPDLSPHSLHQGSVTPQTTFRIPTQSRLRP